MTDLVYRRIGGCVFRRLRGAVLVVGPGREWQRLEGAVARVWMALSNPGSAEELVERFRRPWADLTPAEESTVYEALSMLEAGGLVVAAVERRTADGGPQ